MSNYDDDQSEDGELARSPVQQDEIDFSFSDEEMDTADSLDIRPPQAKLLGPPLKDRSGRHSKSSRRKEHSRRDKKHCYREREKLDSRGKKDSDLIRVVERDSFHSKDHYRDRERERDREYLREKEVYREREREYFREKDVYRDKDMYRDKDVDLYREKESYRYKEPYREKDAFRERDRKMEKEPHRESKEMTIARDRENERERYIEAERNKERKEKEQRDRGSGDKELEDLRSRLLSKRREQQQERREENPEARKAHLERTNKILLADRETSRRKEEGRAALEERRSRRSKRPPSTSDFSPSPPSSSVPPVKKSRPSPSPPGPTAIVTVSDGSDHEENHGEEEVLTASSSGSSTSGSEGEDDTEGSETAEGTDEEEGDDRSGGSRERNREREKEKNSRDNSRNRERPRSPSRTPVSERSDHSEASPRRNRGSRSRTRSRSRSRSHSFSPPRDANGEEIHHMNEEEKPSKGKESSTPPHTPNPALPPYYPAIQGCRSVEEFQCLNRIEEGTYGVVYRAKDKTTDEIVALKRLKMEKEKEGFPITSLREINTLLKGQHPNIVTVREIVVGSNMDKIFIVMDYVEHDLKGLMETMRAKKQVFLPGEVKCLMQQLLKAVDHLHDNWILHRDLKTSNLLLSHKGILKVGDFGLAREYGSPLKDYTPIVVTLWYRAPELLLGAKTYSTPIDIWSVGCIFAEFLTMQALFPGKSEVDQLNRIFKDLGTPNETVWPGWSKLSGSKAQWADQPGLGLRARVGQSLSDAGLNLLQGLLTYDPTRRLQASTALAHNYFKELPQAIDPAMFPTWPAKSEGAKRQHSPKPPPGGDLYKQLIGDDVTGFHMGSSAQAPVPYMPPPTSFSLKF